FTPLVHKLRELNKRVIGIGVEASTSALLPAACDEFLFYERLEGVEPRKPAKRATKRGRGRSDKAAPVVGATAADSDGGHDAEGVDEDAAFALLRATVERLAAKGPVHLSGLKTQVRKQQSDFSEKRFGYGTFLQFVRAARARGFVEMERDADADDYVVSPGPS